MEKVKSTMKSREELVLALRGTNLFGELPDDVLCFVADLSEVIRYIPEESIVEQLTRSDAYYLILEGEASVVLDGQNEVATLGPLDGFGEMGLLLGNPRTASVVSKQEVMAMRLSRENFEECFSRFPAFGLMMSTVLAKRLSKTLKLVPEHKEQEKIPDADVINLLPIPLLQRLRILPVSVDKNTITIGFVDGVQSNILNRVKQFLPSFDIRTVSISSSFFNKALEQVSGIVFKEEPEEEESVIPQKLHSMLERVISEGASDLHLSAKLKPRWRIDGTVREMVDAANLGGKEVFTLLKPLMREETIEEFVRTSDCDFAISFKQYARFRVNLFRDDKGIGAVLRLIPSKILTVGQLGLPKILLELSASPKGLVLITGATGSGKSTTLAAMVDHVNRSQSSHIITLEDPIEFVHKSNRCLINQREIGSHTKGFSRALRAALRQDPDIVLVGELRDKETVQLALEVANTGHLVLGTLHTMNAVSSISRIIDIFPADQQNQIRSGLGEVLRGVVSQTLCKKKGGGRIAAVEVLVVNKAIANQIRREQTSQITSSMETSKALGNQLLNDSLAELVRRNLVEYEEALSKSVDKVSFAKLFGRIYRT
jgi:twitching motility protein PilT